MNSFLGFCISFIGILWFGAMMAMFIEQKNTWGFLIDLVMVLYFLDSMKRNLTIFDKKENEENSA